MSTKGSRREIIFIMGMAKENVLPLRVARYLKREMFVSVSVYICYLEIYKYLRVIYRNKEIS